MNPTTGEIRTLALNERIPDDFVAIPDDLAPSARRHQRRYGNTPVNLKGRSKLASFARNQRSSGGFGKAKNRPRP